MSNSSHFSNISGIRPKPVVYLQEPFAAEVARLAVEVSIALCGVFGNILVCMVVTKRFRTKSPINFYILSLAVADLGVLMVNYPFAIMRDRVRTHWPLGEVVCRYVYPTIEVFFCASIWSITAIAIERYRNIVRMAGVGARRSLVGHKKHVNRRAFASVAAIWVGSFVTVLPISVNYRYYSEQRSCVLVWPDIISEQVYTMAIVLLWYIIPLGIITWTYIHIARSIRQSTSFHKEMDKHGSCSKNSRIKQNSKAKRILTPLVIVFAVTMLPINTLRVIIAFWKMEMIVFQGLYVIFNLSMTLAVLNSASNALIYSIVSKEFRSGFKALLLNWKTHWKNRASILSVDSDQATNLRSPLNVKSPSLTDIHHALPPEYDYIPETDV